MLVTSRGIVLHITKYSDTAIIVELLTEAVGCASFIVRLTHSPRAAVRYTLFRPLALIEMTWEHRPTRNLHRPCAAQTWQPLQTIPYDRHKAAIAFFLAEFLHHAVRIEAEPKPLFSYIANSILWLDAARTGVANFHIVFLLRLVRFLGFSPNLEHFSTASCFDLEASCFVSTPPAHSNFLPPADAARLPLLMRMDYATMHLFKFSGNERSRLLAYINKYYRLHLPNFPELRSLAVLKEIFDAER